MPLTDEAAASVAWRTANRAADFLYASLTASDGSGWAGVLANAPLVGKQLPAMEVARHLGDYAITSFERDGASTSGETLWRWSVQMDFVIRDVAFKALPFGRASAFNLFGMVVTHVYAAVRSEQRLAERAFRAAPAPGLKREDSIFAEDGDTMGTLRPEAVEAARVLASLPRAPAEAAAAHADELPPAEEADERNVLSIGEAPARQPTNRGGRGHTKKRD